MTALGLILISIMATIAIAAVFACAYIDDRNQRLRRALDTARRLRTRALNQRDDATLRAKAFEARSGELINERNEAVQMLNWRLGGMEACGTYVRPVFSDGLVKAGDA